LIASPAPNGSAKADSFKSDSIVVEFEKNSNGQNLAKQSQRKNYPSKILCQAKINLNQEEIFISTERNTLCRKYSLLFSETKTLCRVNIRFKSKVLGLREKNITNITNINI